MLCMACICLAVRCAVPSRALPVCMPARSAALVWQGPLMVAALLLQYSSRLVDWMAREEQ